MTDYLKIDAADVLRHIESLFTTFPELAEDEELRAGVIEGETDLDKVIERALAQKMDADIMVSGINDILDGLNERSLRFMRKSDAMRTLIRSLMLSANLKSLPLPAATISIQAGRQSVQITDEAAIPTQLTVIKRTPDKTAIGAALKAGEDVPGAQLVTGEPSLTIRRV